MANSVQTLDVSIRNANRRFFMNNSG